MSKLLPLLGISGRFTIAAAILVSLVGCQAVTSAPVAQVRIIDTSPDAAGIDTYEGSTAMAYNLGFGTLTSYIQITPGNYAIAAVQAGSKQTLASSRATLLAATQYTILIGSGTGSLEQVVLTDQSQPAPPGQISLRFLDQAARVGAVDVYLVPAGQQIAGVGPTATGIAFDANTGYLNVPAGTYTLIVVPAGTVPGNSTGTIYKGAQVGYSPGAVRTFVLIDQQLVSIPGIQVITAEDFNLPATS